MILVLNLFCVRYTFLFSNMPVFCWGSVCGFQITISSVAQSMKHSLVVAVWICCFFFHLLLLLVVLIEERCSDRWTRRCCWWCFLLLFDADMTFRWIQFTFVWNDLLSHRFAASFLCNSIHPYKNKNLLSISHRIASRWFCCVFIFTTITQMARTHHSSLLEANYSSTQHECF